MAKLYTVGFFLKVRGSEYLQVGSAIFSDSDSSHGYAGGGSRGATLKARKAYPQYAPGSTSPYDSLCVISISAGEVRAADD